MKTSIPLFAAFLLTINVWASERTTPFPQEVRTEFTTVDGLPSDDVLAVVIDPQGRPVISTAKGMAIFKDGKWSAMESPSFAPRFLNGSKSLLVAADEKKVAFFMKGAWRESTATASGEIQSLHSGIVGTDTGLYMVDSDVFTAMDSPKESILAIAEGPNGQMALGTPSALYVGTENNWESVFPEDENYRWAPRDVRAVAYDGKGRLWFGAQQGVGVLEDGKWRLFTGREGLPYKPFVSAASGETDAVWFATEKGVIRATDGGFAYRFSKRWLPDDGVQGVAVEADGTAWIATSKGLSRIVRKSMTFAEKSTHFTHQSETRHNRDGFIATCALKERYNPESSELGITDNDGLYTAWYGAAQAFRYAATGDPEAKALATRSMERIKWLVDITGSGMPARVIIPADWHEPVNEQMGAEFNKKRRERDPFWKLITPRFPTTADGKWMWKCDTSSDELSGHYFYYGIYYDLVAETEAEKELARSAARSVTDHMIENGFLLRDHDGLPTRWGRHDPEYLNSIEGWAQRGLNSMMMLSYLTVTEHVTGDPKYGEAKKMLIEKHNYHINSIKPKEFFPPGNVVPWDNNLSLMSLYGLMNYETDPELLYMWRLGTENAWSHVSKQKNAFWNFIFQACADGYTKKAEAGFFEGIFPQFGPYAAHNVKKLAEYEPHLQDSMESLRGMPLDLIGYHMDNRHRLDIVFDNTPGAQTWSDHHRGTYGWHFDGRALPIEERGHVRQDRDAFNLNANEGDGWTEHEGSFFLLPYWMGVHHGFIK
jgi:hypothetical protein